MRASIYYFSADLLGWQSPALDEKALELSDVAVPETGMMVVTAAVTWQT